MEGLKETFNNLSESEKRKFLEEITSSSSHNFSEFSHSKSPTKIDFDRFLQIFASGQKRISEGNSSEGNSTEVNSERDSRKKQKTLDSWLIKRDASSSKDKLVQSQCKTANQRSNLLDVDNLSKNNSDSNNVVVSSDDSGTSSLFHTVYNDKSSSNLKDAEDKSEKSNKTLKVQTNEIITLATEKYNLRSNRKKSSLRSPIKKCDSYSERDRKKEMSPNDSTNVNCFDMISKNNESKSSVEMSKNSLVNENFDYQFDAVSQSNQQVSKADLSQSNYATYCKLKNECSQVGLDIDTILKDKNIQNILNDQELNDEAVVFMGTFKSNTGKEMPVIHLLEHENKLSETVIELQKISVDS